jgi:TolB protein
MLENSELPPRPERKRRERGIHLSRGVFAGLIILIIALIAAVVLLFNRSTPPATVEPGSEALSTSEYPSPPPTILNTATTSQNSGLPTAEIVVVTATPNPQSSQTIPGMIVFAQSEFGYTHLFAYHPEVRPVMRLTFGEWDDIHPALSPDGTMVAFASNRGQGWDIYILDLTSGEVHQVTNDPAYDGRPAWDPTGEWLAYEKYVDANLEIYMQQPNVPLSAARITSDPYADTQPTWSADGNLIAFTSNRSGSDDIWLIDLSQLGESGYETNFTSNSRRDQRSPSFSNNGTQLAWIEARDGVESIYIADALGSVQEARYVGSGSQAAWSPDGNYLVGVLETPNEYYLTGMFAANGSLLFPPIRLEGSLHGVSWHKNGFLQVLPQAITSASLQTPQVTWADELTPSPGNLYGRQSTIEIPDIVAPSPALNALVIEPFFALRNRVEMETGWDVLSNLDNLFVPLTQPLEPGYAINWLHTGRAFALNSTLAQIHWMYVVKEPFGDQTYWRVFIKTRLQDGSQGQPLFAKPWDFQARFSGNTTSYENGGKPFDVIPAGYYIDFTDLALQYGWERQAAQSNWRSFTNGVHFNEFVITNGLDWESAMLQLYPAEIFDAP